MNKTLVLFDFDRTLTRSDSLLPFLIFALGWQALLVGLPHLMWRWAALLWRGKWSAEAAKAALLGGYFGGRSRAQMEALGERFAEAIIPRLLRPEARGWLQQHRATGATMAVVSASVDIWLQGFCRKEGLGLLCTEAAYDGEGRFTGSFAMPNCKWEEKARRIRAAFDLTQIEHIVAYGNWPEDEAMFALAHEVVIV